MSSNTKKSDEDTQKTQASNPMWGGQFASAPAGPMEEINASIGFDKRLHADDVTGSIAHATMLAKQGIISQEESQSMIDGLKQVGREIEAGEFVFSVQLEDIHMNIEARLKEIIGDVAGKLHTGRSRNDQVATDFKLWVRYAFDQLDQTLKTLQAQLIEKADTHADTIMPGFTHLQSAQPVTLGHHLLAYVEMFGRDRSRIADARARLNECPLGVAALAGTSFPIDREMTAKALGFDKPTANSLDSVSDRDFALEFLSIVSICSMHLSRLAEEMVLWASQQFGFITFSDAFATGSSIMPQKKNPDAAELVRGKTGRIYGHLMSLLTTMKALPLAYNKDMQEDKEPVFEAYDQLNLCVTVMIGMVGDFTTNKEVMKKAAEAGYSSATDLADMLVHEHQVPFRDAHHIAANVVKLASSMNVQLHELTEFEVQKIDPRVTENILANLTIEDVVARRTSFGGTAPKLVKDAVEAARKKYL